MLATLNRLFRLPRPVPATVPVPDLDNPYPAMFAAHLKEIETQLDHLSRVLSVHEKAVELGMGPGLLTLAEIDVTCALIGEKLAESRDLREWIATLH